MVVVAGSMCSLVCRSLGIRISGTNCGAEGRRASLMDVEGIGRRESSGPSSLRGITQGDERVVGSCVRSCGESCASLGKFGGRRFEARFADCVDKVRMTPKYSN